MIRKLFSILACFVLLFHPLAALTPDPIKGGVEIDLASDTDWTISLDGKPPRPIKVPGGGWNSDRQEPRIQEMMDVNDYVLYERKITIPKVFGEETARIHFGAVAHGCEVFLDGQKVGEHHGPQVAFDIDLTTAAKPGQEQVLQVKAFHRRHYMKPGENIADVAVGWDYPEGADEATKKEANFWYSWHGLSKVGYGIVRSISLVVEPVVQIQDYFIRPSVTKQELSADVWIRNASKQDRTVDLKAALSSWNKRDWAYPTLPPVEATIPACQVVKVTLGPVPWTLGPQSYWWPNIPFAEDYIAQLHLLHFSLTQQNQTWQTKTVRFGFVEHSEGPYYYMVNGVRVTGMSDATAEGQTSYFDGYGSAAAWLPPTGDHTGCPETWRRYMRLRNQHQSPALLTSHGIHDGSGR